MKTRAAEIMFREPQALEHALSIKAVRPLVERFFCGKRISVADVGCGSCWVSASNVALILDKFGPSAIKLVGVDPLANSPFITHEFEASPVRSRTQFVMCNQELSEDTIEKLRALGGSGFDLVTTFNPDLMARIFPLMVRLLHPGGVFIASIAGDMSVERNLEALRSLSGLDVLADCLNPTTDSLWNKHLFVAQALEPTTPKVRSGTA